MTRYILSPLILLVAILPASAQPAPLDLRGKTLEATFNELLPGMGSADNGPRTGAQQRWQDICFALGAPGNEKMRIEACKLMSEKLDAKTPNAARLWLLQQLQRIGHEESLDAVAAVLEDKDDEVREMAVRALANNPSPKATGKLTAALSAATGKAKIGILNGLGHRGDSAAVVVITDTLAKHDDEIAISAARALGRISGAESAESLVKVRVLGAKGNVLIAIDNSLLIHADRLLKAGKIKDALEIYTTLNVPDEPRSIRLAALRGTIQTSGDKAGELVLKVLAGDDAKARDVAIGQIENLNASALKTLAASMDKLSVPSRVAVITAIAARGDRSQLPVALSAAKSTEAEVKRAGILALGRLGDASTVEFLLDVMSGKDATAGIAAESIAALPAEGVNEKIIAVLEAETIAARKVALIGILERRKAVGGVSALLKSAADSDASVRTAAFAGLKVMAAPENVPGMIAALLKTAKGNERDQAELAIVAVSAQLANSEKRAEPVLAVIKDAPKSRVADLLPLLGRLGGTEAHKVIHDAVSSTDPLIHDAAIIGICKWPNASANDDLLALAEKGHTDAEKLRAIQALIRVNAVLIDRTAEEKLAALAAMKKTMELATRDQERRSILEGVGFVRHIETLHFVVPYLDQPAFAQSACKGVVELAHSKMLREPNKAEFDKVLDRVIAMCKDKGLVDRAKQYKEGR
jgi:HEAT repeat protein